MMRRLFLLRFCQSSPALVRLTDMGGKKARFHQADTNNVMMLLYSVYLRSGQSDLKFD